MTRRRRMGTQRDAPPEPHGGRSDGPLAAVSGGSKRLRGGHLFKHDRTPETLADFEQAQRSAMDARTVDLAVIAIKLAVLSESDCNGPISDIARDLAAAGIVTLRRAV